VPFTGCAPPAKDGEQIYEESIIRQSAPHEAVRPVAAREQHPKLAAATAYSVDVCHYEDREDRSNRNAYCFVSFQGYPGAPIKFCTAEYRTDIDGSWVGRVHRVSCDHYASIDIAKRALAEADKR
jgi:hypothetical protein